MKRRYISLAFLAVFIYILLIALLVRFESASPDASITGPGGAVWYTLTTLTTVGYGDTYPVTPGGRVIGALFQLMSIGVLVTLISTVLSLLRSRLLPLLMLSFKKNQHWYIFSEVNPRTRLMAEALAKEPAAPKKHMIIFFDSGTGDDGILPAGVRTAFPPEKLLAFKNGKGSADVFAMGDDQAENDRLAWTLKDLPCRVFSMSSFEPDRLSDRLFLFDPHDVCARLYWHLYPVTSPFETIVLIGSGRYADALLEQAVLINVLAPDQRISYHVFGDFTDFRNLHPSLGQIFDGSGDTADVLIFHDEPWNSDLSLLKNAHRILFCGDSADESIGRAAALRRACPLKGRVFVRGAAPLEGFVTFGTPDQLITPDHIIQRRLNETAIKLHNLYHDQVAGSPAWEELSGFLRRSNIASADHLPVKARILLGGDVPFTPDTIARAASVYEHADEELLERCRRIEHERWMRFHLMNNWQYAPVRDNAARLHPLLLPYEKLSRADQLKDDYSWKLLTELANKGKEG